MDLLVRSRHEEDDLVLEEHRGERLDQSIEWEFEGAGQKDLGVVEEQVLDHRAMIVYENVNPILALNQQIDRTQRSLVTISGNFLPRMLMGLPKNNQSAAIIPTNDHRMLLIVHSNAIDSCVVDRPIYLIADIPEMDETMRLSAME